MDGPRSLPSVFGDVKKKNAERTVHEIEQAE
jgi:hypothetical protein